MFRSSLVVPWFVFGSSLVFYTVLKYKVQEKGILIKVLFALSAGGVTLWCGVAKRRGGGSRAAVAAHAVSGGYIRRKMLGELTPSIKPVAFAM